MKDIKISKNRLGMNLYETELDCGMTFYFMPLPSKVNIRSMHLFTKFGSIDEKFVTGEDKKVVHVQDGTAHFLEHCAFYNENGKDALEEISKMGCYGNAWTNFDHTTYYIHTTNNDRQKSLEYLINFVTAPYFTEAVVKKEQGIISQEIARANDNISSILYNNLRKGLFVKHPLRKPILGNIDSIMNITTDELMFAHNTFYNPSNLRLILFIPEENVSDYILMLEKINEKFEKKGKPSYLYVDEPKEVNSKRIITEGNVAENLVALGFKGNMGDSENLLKQLQANDLLLSCLFSSTTSSVEKLIKKGVVRDSFYASNSYGRGYEFMYINGYTQDINAFEDNVKEHIKKQLKGQLRKSTFELIKSSALARLARLSESQEIRELEYFVVSHLAAGLDPIALVDIVKDITYEDIIQAGERYLLNDETTLSVILPRSSLKA